MGFKGLVRVCFDELELSKKKKKYGGYTSKSDIPVGSEDCLRYVWNVAEAVMRIYCEDSVEYQETAQQLLSEGERYIVKKNLDRGDDFGWGISLAPDREYAFEGIMNSFLLAEKVQKELLNPPATGDIYRTNVALPISRTGLSLNHYRERAERTEFYQVMIINTSKQQHL